MERRVRRECGLAAAAVCHAAGGRLLHAAAWDDLQWATASGVGAARRHITTAVDEYQKAGLAVERALRCARHVSECRAGRNATLLRRAAGRGCGARGN